MKYYSEITKELYESQDELLEAEANMLEANDIDHCDGKCSQCTCDSCDVEDDINTLDAEEKEVLNNKYNKPSKKELANKIEQTDTNLKQAYADYKVAEQQVSELSKTYLEAVDALLNPAKQAIKDAEKAKYEAIKEFNDMYGAYQVTYTGARAAEEMLKTLKDLDRADSLFDTLFTDNWMKRWLF